MADLIFPAFFTPYVAMVFYPIAGLAGLIAEVVVYRLVLIEERLSRVLWLALAVNAVSSLLGVVLAGVLPSGLIANQNEGLIAGPLFGRFAIASWFVLFLLSVATEYPMLLLLTRRRPLAKPFLAVCLANIASYLVLAASFIVLSSRGR